MSSSNLFESYKSVGFICDNIPIHLKKLGSQTFITTSIGKGWQVYNTDKLRLVMVGHIPSNINRISSLTSIRDYTYTSCGNNILVFKRNNEYTRLISHENNIYYMTTMGHFLLSVDDNQQLNIWNTQVQKLYTSIQFPSNRHITCILHPHTYLNKIVIGFNDGGMELWNIRSRSCVYKFDTNNFNRNNNTLEVSLGLINDENIKKQKTEFNIVTIVQSPAIDIVAIGLSNGNIIIYNLKEAKILLEFFQKEGRVTSLSFRTDNIEHTLVSGCMNGTINIWNLENGQLLYSMLYAHNSTINSLHFLAQEPILISTGNDNALKQWIFDSSDHTPRLLKQRVGHCGPPKRIRFYKNTNNNSSSHQYSILSASDDKSFRIFSVLRDQFSHELSQGSLESKSRRKNIDIQSLKLSPILDFDTIETRERDWCNIITCHQYDSRVCTWSFHQRKLLKTKFRHRVKKNIPITAVCISSCGNFGMVGNDDGDIFVYNLQSGQYRGKFEITIDHNNNTIDHNNNTNDNNNNNVNMNKNINKNFKKKRQRSFKQSAHNSKIEGLVIDAFNKTLISASFDGTLNFWDFNKRNLLKTIKMSAEISQIILNKESSLLAVATDDFDVKIFDIITYRIVRHCRGHHQRITDMCFSPDCRLLVTSCIDGGVRVFDIPTGRMVDWLVFDKPVTTLTFSPQGEFLATAHTNSVGIFLWANRSYFTSVYMRSVPNKPTHMTISEAKEYKPQENEKSNENENKKETMNKDNDLFGAITYAPQPLPSNDGSDDLLTLSELPKSKWKNLALLEVIKERNKPIQPPEQPPDAPFFLPTTSEVNTQLDLSKLDDQKTNDSKIETNVDYKSKILSNFDRTLTPLIKLLKLLEEDKEKNENIIIYLKNLSPSAIDSEIRSIANDPIYEFEELELVLNFLIEQFKTNLNFEFLQSILHLLLKVHGDLITTYEDLRIKLKELLTVQDQSWNRLDQLIQSNICLVSHFTKTTI